MNELISKLSLFKDTAIFIMFDESGGCYDSEYI
jgi:phospholipase C